MDHLDFSTRYLKKERKEQGRKEGKEEGKKKFFNNHSPSICSVCLSYILEMRNQIRYSSCPQKAYSPRGETVQQIQFASHPERCHHTGKHWSHDRVELQGHVSHTKASSNFAIFKFPYKITLLLRFSNVRIQSYIVWIYNVFNLYICGYVRYLLLKTVYFSLFSLFCDKVFPRVCLIYWSFWKRLLVN